MPCPYWVILNAVQLYSGNAAIRPATTLVFPTLRECPPMTMRDMEVRRWPLVVGRWPFASRHLWRMVLRFFCLANDQGPRTNDRPLFSCDPCQRRQLFQIFAN